MADIQDRQTSHENGHERLSRIPNDMLFRECRRIMSEGRDVLLTAKGSSMYPFIRNGDKVLVGRKETYMKGDIVLALTSDGKYVMHRIYKKKTDGYYMVGDAQTQIEGPLRRDQIFALIIKVKRKGKIIRPGNFWWEFFGLIWLPSYSAICRGCPVSYTRSWGCAGYI